MLTFIKLDDTHILYGDVMIHKDRDKTLCFYGLHGEVEMPTHTLIDEDDSIWYGLCAIAVTLPRQKDGDE